VLFEVKFVVLEVAHHVVAVNVEFELVFDFVYPFVFVGYFAIPGFALA
jgi:hypothetical protein